MERSPSASLTGYFPSPFFFHRFIITRRCCFLQRYGVVFTALRCCFLQRYDHPAVIRIHATDPRGIHNQHILYADVLQYRVSYQFRPFRAVAMGNHQFFPFRIHRFFYQCIHQFGQPFLMPIAWPLCTISPFWPSISGFTLNVVATSAFTPDNLPFFLSVSRLSNTKKVLRPSLNFSSSLTISSKERPSSSISIARNAI